MDQMQAKDFDLCLDLCEKKITENYLGATIIQFLTDTHPFMTLEQKK
jgi:hypothetical protein